MLNATRSIFTGMFRRFGLGTIAGVVLVLGIGVAAFAYWTTVGTGAGSASASGLNPPTNVSLAVNDSAVTVSFTGVTPTNGTLSGYYVQRNNGSVTSNACGTNPATPGTFLTPSATSCADTSVPNGTYTYTVTSVLNTWKATSEPSSSLVVTGDTHAPSQVVSMTSSNALKTGNTIYFRAAAAGSLTLSAAVTDGISGPASATFPAISTTGWTHASETVTTGSGTNPKTFASSTFTWNADAATPSTYGVVGRDVVGNQTTTDLTFVADNDGPTGGTLTVNGTTGTSDGAVNVITTGANFTGSKTDFSADAGSGYLSTTLTREASTSETCADWATATTISSVSEDGSGSGMTVTLDRCYRYTLTGTDKVGNTSIRRVTVSFVDTTNPAQVMSISSATNAVLVGKKLYYNSTRAGEFVLSSTVTDNSSGPERVIFSAIATSGWNHDVETVTTGVGVNPKTFTSSRYWWTANPSNPSGSVREIKSYDRAGNEKRDNLETTVDNTGPAVSGALTVNGAGGSAGGTTSYTNTSFSGTKTDFTDAGAGISTNVLTREFASITSGVCDSFGSATVITSISETTPAVGCYRYTLTATDLLDNVAVLKTTVMVDTTAPSSVVVSETGANGYLSGSTLYFRSGVNSSVTLSAAVTDAFPGAASATFPAISTSNWTHNAETITSGSGTNPITYTSSSFSWTSTAVAPTGTRTISGADKAGNSTDATPISFVADGSAPTGGALTVASTPGTALGATVVTNSGLFSGSYTNFDTDAGSGFASSVLVRETATLTSGACGSFGNSSTITSISESALATGCYRYTLTGTDNVGNTSVLRTTVQVDVTAPTVVVTENGANSVQSGSTIYYRGDLATSTVLSAAVTDAASGAASASFPDVATTGWTHNAETISSAASTSGTTKTYNSSNFSWTASPSNPGSYTVTGTDAAGNTGTSAVTFTSDTTGPTGGVLTVDSVTGTSDGAVDVITTAKNFSGSKTNYSADAGSGYSSTTLTREVSTSSSCQSFGSLTTISSISEKGPQDANPTTANNTCYRYTLTGTDNLGNTSKVSVIVSMTDTTDPTPVLTMGSATNAVLSQSSSTAATIYYRKDLNGSFTLVNTLTDYASGPKSSLFPAISTTGWTHNVETVTSGTGARPTIAYTSTSWSWTGSGSLANPSSKNVTSSDQANNTINTALTFTSDTTAPTGGSITVNGTASTNGGTTAYAPNTFTASVANFTDAGVGISTNVITRATATLTGSTCGTFGTAAVVASISESGATGCIQYVLTGTDLLANSTTSTITVKVDGSAPTVAVSGETGANSYRDGSNIYYRSGSSGSFTLTATVDDAFPGAKSATFPAIATTGWTHSAETVTTATSTSGTVTTYTSSSFTWTASPSVPATYTVTGADQAGNTGTADVTFVADAAGPTAGALAVNSVDGTSVGSVSYTNTGTFSGTFTQFSADAGSGFATSAITKESATLTNGTCGSYSAGTAPTGGSISETTLAEGCYRYTVTGTDNVGNTSVLATVVMVDKTAPTQTISASGSNASVSGSTMYYKGNVAGSTTLSSVLADGKSCGLNMTFPSLSGTSTGFTFTTNTDSSSSGSCPSETFSSANALTWTNPTSSSPTMAIVGSDKAGNTVTTTLTLTNDITVPTTGALSADGTAATSGGSVKNSTTDPFNLSVTDFTDAGSGLASSTLTYATATYDKDIPACGSYGSATTISKTGSPLAYPTTFANTTHARCIRFTLTGTDKVGNTSTLIVTHTRN